MDTAGKAVLFSGVTVLISLSAVMLVPSPAFRSMSLGIMLSVAFVLLAALTLLPAVLAWLGDRVDRLALPWVHAGEHRSPAFARWAERLWRRPVGLRHRRGRDPRRARAPRARARDGNAVDQGRARRRTARASGYTQVQEAFGPGAPGTLQIVAPEATQPTRWPAALEADPGIAAVAPGDDLGRDCARSSPTPTADPVRPGGRRRRSSGCAPRSRPTRSSAARPPRTTTSRRRSRAARCSSSASSSRSGSCSCSSRCRRP